MPCLRCMRNWIHAFVHDYERLKKLAKNLIYIHIGCSLIGSIDKLYNYMSLINLVIALVGSSVIAMNCQSLTRTYTVLLFCAAPLDISWYHIPSISIERTRMFLFIISLKMEMVVFCLRFFSSPVWIQMCRLGSISHADSTTDTSRSSNNDSDDDSGYKISTSDDTNSSGDDDQQHNPLLSKQELENEVQRLEMCKAQLLESIEIKKRDLEQNKALNLQLKALKQQMGNAKEVPKNSSN